MLCVTVLQHILDPARLGQAIRNLEAALKPGGQIVLLEAAPTYPTKRCDTATFTARSRQTYLDLFARYGLEVHALNGVDPAPFRSWLLPYVRSLPRLLRVPTVAAATALSLPLDSVFGRRMARYSWHVVFVLKRASEAHRGD